MALLPLRLAARRFPLPLENARCRLRSSHRRSAHADWRLTDSHCRAEMPIGASAFSIGASPIAIGRRKCRSASLQWPSETRQWPSAALQNALALGNALCRDGNAFREGAKIVGDRSDGQPGRANEVFRDGNLLRRGSEGRGRRAQGLQGCSRLWIAAASRAAVESHG